MTQNFRVKTSKSRKMCAVCIGFVRFASNKNNWTIDTCDYCGQTARVKVEDNNESHDMIIRSLKPIPYPISLPKTETVSKTNFWITWRGISVIGGIVVLALLLFV